MATWHQKRAGAIQPHATLWLAVNDPPNGCCGVISFETESCARECARNTPHSYVIPPHGLVVHTVRVMKCTDMSGKNHWCEISVNGMSGLAGGRGFREETRRFRTYPAAVRASREAASIIRRMVAKYNLQPFQIAAVDVTYGAAEPFYWGK